jgi:uncharacterized membrane protein YgdD (TMEM256/DUF423 family)
MTMSRRFFILAAVLGGLSVAFGAFAAHGLKPRLDAAMLANWETGVRYQFYHAFALMAAAWVTRLLPDCKSARVAGWLFLAGVLLFSGSLYIMALTGMRWLGMITPFGGVAFIAGWILLALAGRRL